MEVIQWPDSRLLQIANLIDVSVTPPEEIEEKIEAMKLVLSEETHGVGLAATQVGWMRRAFVMVHLDGECTSYKSFLNPEIVKQYGDTSLDWEGCLSAKKAAQLQVRRFETVDLRWEDLVCGELVSREETFSGLNARIIQHEVDHLDGKMYFHRVPANVRNSMLKKAYPPVSTRLSSGPSKEEIMLKRGKRKNRSR